MKTIQIKHSLAAKRIAIALVSVLACGSFSAYAAGELTSIGESSSEATAISADGTVVVGDFQSAGTINRAFRWTAGDELLTKLDENRESYARGVNRDGTVIVGNYGYGVPQAFYWTKDLGITALGGDGLTSSDAYGVSDDGNVIVGWGKGENITEQAYRWTRSSASDAFVAEGLGALNPTDTSRANGVSADGKVVVGINGEIDLQERKDNREAFRWTTEGGMRSLGYLDGGVSSEALAANEKGTVVVGWSDIRGGATTEAFRWVKNSGDEEGIMKGLGLGGGSSSRANAVSEDGKVVVGNFGTRAFRWTEAADKMISVEDWLQGAGVATTGFQRLELANGVSADGNTVVGRGIRDKDGGGRREAYIARVTPEVSGIVGLTDLNQSLAQTYAIDSQMASLHSMVFNGAHHRSISEMAVGKGNNCFWATGDFGAHWRQANGKPVIAEVGVCHDFSARGIRAGVGIGAGSANLDLANNGASRLSGQYALAEIDWQIPESDLLLSVLGSYGQWDADLTRGYAIAGTTQSEGETDVDVVGLRARLDWQDAFHLGTVSISPRFAYTVIRSQVDAYQEQGGSAPARFDERTHSAREFRAGLTGKHRLNTKTTLFGHLEAAHRFDSESARMRGSATVLGGSTLTFDETNPIERNWLRVGAEVAHQLTPSSRISISGFVASAGEDQDAGMAISFQQAF